MLKAEYVIVFDMTRNLVFICEILAELKIITFDFIFLLLMNNNDVIIISNSEKITRNTRHINIQYHHI